MRRQLCVSRQSSTGNNESHLRKARRCLFLRMARDYFLRQPARSAGHSPITHYIPNDYRSDNYRKAIFNLTDLLGNVTLND
ncbi:hypothetical protein PUN28_004999 [Cardiocondyla obscurior]|uniref:Uncharacterized protein n=1 Tax=Cardiocondyla obscurior TaxID=286306 RepID=A0AAW2GFF7_9HYME